MNTNSTKLKKVSLALRAALYSTAGTIAFSATSIQAAENDDEEADSNKIVITGSRIKRTDVESLTPVVTITAEEMEEKGYTSVYNALQSLVQNTGRIQGEQSPNSFTPNANELNLRGFGAGRTLVLLNGRRAADNPTPFNNESNFFNFATIPMVMVERIEVLTGGASAIYGSDAVAGVVNIILKKEIVDTTVNVRVGQVQGTKDQRFQLATGWSNGTTNFSAALEYSDVDGIRGWDVDYLDSIADRPGTDPDGFYLNRAAVIWNNDTAQYIDPGEGTCEGLGLTRDLRPDLDGSGNNTGYFCGLDDDGEGTLRNPREQKSVSFNFSHDLGGGSEAFANGYYWEQETYVYPFAQWLQQGGIYDFDPATFDGSYEQYFVQRFYQPSEIGNSGSNYNEDVFNISIGTRGFLSGGAEWEVGATLSKANTKITAPRFFEEEMGLQAYFGEDVLDYGADFNVSFPVYSWPQYLESVAAGNSTWFYAPLENLDQILGLSEMNADSEMKGVDFSITGDLFEMEAGPAQYAAILEYYSQSYDLIPDERSTNLDGMGWYNSGSSAGGGERDRFSAGLETSFPVTDSLTLNLAGRYDKYNDNSDVGGKPTGQLGFTWNINEDLMLRGNFGTSFRAPDMHYLFAEDSPSFISVIDPLRCEFDEDCDADSRPNLSRGEISLKEEEGTNTSFGIVWAPSTEFNLTLDYYEIKLEDSISYMSASRLLQTEYECATGSLDPSSAICIDSASRIIREPADSLPGGGGLTSVYDPIAQLITSPFNLGTQEQSGLDFSANYKLTTDTIGEFRFNLAWSGKLKDEAVFFPGDEPINVKDDLAFGGVRSNTQMSVNWSIDKFNTVLVGNRRGSIPNGSAATAPTYRLDAWTTYNMSVAYAITDDTRVSLLVNNLLDEDAQLDPTLGRFEWPYFDTGNSNAYGRNVAISLQYTF